MKELVSRLNIIDFSIFIISIGLIHFTLDFPFYWDNTVQISIPANWYFETNFNFFYLPDEIATGHPTFVGMYFAFLWKIFGRSLFVCHLGMFPFVFGLLFQLHKLLNILKINNLKTKIIIFCFILFDTTILSQLSLITFDIIQLFFLFLCINAILKNNLYLLSFSFILLIMTSLRGTISAGGLVVFHFLYNIILIKKYNFKSYLVYLPGVLAISLFLVFFKYHKGWVIHNTVSNSWVESGKFASFNEVLFNVGVFIWRLIDYGRVLIYLFFSVLLITIIKNKKINNKKIQILLLLAFSQFLVFFPIIIIYKNPFAHRYLIPIIIPVTILTVYWIKIYFSKPNLYLSILFISLISGHFWLYPEKLSQGWDGSTIHWNLFELEGKMEAFIEKNNVEKKQIGTFFSLYQSKYYSHIDSIKNGYKKANMNKDKYILYSNSFNVSDGVIDSLSSDKYFTLLKEYRKNRIFLKLYKSNH